MTISTYQISEYKFHRINNKIIYTMTTNLPNQNSILNNRKTDLSINTLNGKKIQKRITTYFRNEILLVYIDDISLIFIENSITYVITKDGKKSCSNYTLDQIYDKLNQKKFFRVNRQVILGASSIQKIIKIGPSLKIETLPKIDIPIMVGKNKVSKFKKWLNQ